MAELVPFSIEITSTREYNFLMGTLLQAREDADSDSLDEEYEFLDLLIRRVVVLATSAGNQLNEFHLIPRENDA